MMEFRPFIGAGRVAMGVDMHQSDWASGAKTLQD